MPPRTTSKSRSCAKLNDPDGGARAGRGSAVRALDGRLDRVEAGADALGDLALAEAGGDHVAENRRRHRIRQRRLEPVADLDAHLPVVEEDQEDHAVVEVLPPDAPGLGEPDREVLEALPVERSEDGDDDLIATAPLALDELLLEPIALGRVSAPA